MLLLKMITECLVVSTCMFYVHVSISPTPDSLTNYQL